MFELEDKLKIITINQDYMGALYAVDSQVFYSPINYDSKPYLGILINDNGRKYAIPLTSAKPVHLNWDNYNNGRLLIYEIANPSALSSNDIYKTLQDGTTKHILAALMINKMIPIKDGLYSVVDINHRSNDNVVVTKYKQLLNKEFSFCVSKKEKIVNEANKIYEKQIKTGKVYPKFCSFIKLEEVCDRYNNN